MSDSSSRKLPRVFKTLAWFLAFDFLIAYWLAIHNDKALQLLLSLIPLAGIGAVMWGFMPTARKDEFAAWVDAWLGIGAAPWVAAFLFLGALAYTTTRAGVTVTALDGSVATVLRLTQGPELDEASVAQADTARLNALTSPVSFIRRMAPGGQQAWLLSEDLISRQLVRLRPWRPRDLLYPADFDSLVTVTLLPGGWIFNLAPSQARVTLIGGRDATDTLVAIRDTATIYQLSSFPQTGVALDSTRWGSILAASPRDDSSLAEQWTERPVALTARRPIRQGERVTWSVTIDTLTRSGRVVLNDVQTDLYLAF